MNTSYGPDVVQRFSLTHLKELQEKDLSNQNEYGWQVLQENIT